MRLYFFAVSEVPISFSVRNQWFPRENPSVACGETSGFLRGTQWFPWVNLYGTARQKNGYLFCIIVTNSYLCSHEQDIDLGDAVMRAAADGLRQTGR